MAESTQLLGLLAHYLPIFCLVFATTSGVKTSGTCPFTEILFAFTQLQLELFGRHD